MLIIKRVDFLIDFDENLSEAELFHEKIGKFVLKYNRFPRFLKCFLSGRVRVVAKQN